MDLPRVVFVGRTGADALAFFSLDLAAWRGRRVLDWPGGPGSSTALARAAGVESVAADPLYTLPLPELERRCRDDVAFTMAHLALSPTLRPDFDLPRFRQGKLEALEAFLADRRDHPEAYRAAALPSLPFGAASFDLALCGHLLILLSPDRRGRTQRTARLRPRLAPARPGRTAAGEPAGGTDLPRPHDRTSPPGASLGGAPAGLPASGVAGTTRAHRLRRGLRGRDADAAAAAPQRR